jgi:predicted acyltransferase
MFWIIGGEGIFHALAKLTGWSIFLAMSYQLEHSEWHGFRFYDMIFPLFLFLAGVSMPYSLNKRIERGDSKQKIYLHVFRRMILLVFFGMVYNGFFKFEWETMRYASVLGHIGLGWFFAALIFLNYNKRGQYLWFFGILIGYWLMMVIIPVPGYGAGNLTMEGSLAGYIDRHLLPGRLYMGIHDPEGLLSTIPSIATALLGVLAGHYLRTEKIRTTKLKKGLMIGITGILTLLAGLFWSIFFPINKDLWTSSFVLFSGGWSLILLSLFYLVIDVWNHRRWAFFFIIIGLNPITIYMCQAGIISFSGMSDFFFGGLISYFPEAGHDVLKAIGYTIMSWLFLYFLYRQKIFLKV